MITVLIILTHILFIANGETEQKNGSTVFDRGLVKKTPHSSEILNNYNQYTLTTDARIEKRSIGFLSDSEESYKDATIFTNKFTYISPNWYNIKRVGDRQYSVTGVENFNRKWIEDMMETKRDIKIVPKITFKGWTAADFAMLASSDYEWISFANELVHFCQTFHFHGLVLDVWNDFYGKIPTGMLILLTQELCVRLRMNYFEAILIISPNFNQFTRNTFEDLAEFVSRFSLETFENPAECSLVKSGVPIASLEAFINEISVEDRHRHLLLIGLNSHGYIYSKSTKKIIRKAEYLGLLKQYDDILKYDDILDESYFDITINNEEYRVTFPTLYSINERVQLAIKLGVGISFWKLADGLEYFYELL